MCRHLSDNRYEYSSFLYTFASWKQYFSERHKMARHIIMITGGQRSGKSQYAEQLALEMAENPVYVATAHVWDDNFRQRVILHQARRGERWTNIEEERYPSRYDLNGRVVLVDCLTLWATNYLFDSETGAERPDSEDIQGELEDELARLTSQDATFIFVTNEIGMGGVSSNPLQCRFADLQGAINQYVAAIADEVVLMVSGIPVKIKEQR
jgi:adenosylcobinamide kinase/adenosylcobinamide-phosphate guanylyltransferase